MDEQRAGKEFAQAADVKRILRCSIHPSRFWDVRRLLCHEVVWRSTWGSGLLPPSSLKINTVIQYQLVDALPKGGQKFLSLHAHFTEQRAVMERGSRFIADGQSNGQVTDPNGLL